MWLLTFYDSRHPLITFQNLVVPHLKINLCLTELTLHLVAHLKASHGVAYVDSSRKGTPESMAGHGSGTWYLEWQGLLGRAAWEAWR